MLPYPPGYLPVIPLRVGHGGLAISRLAIQVAQMEEELRPAYVAPRHAVSLDIDS